MSQPGSCRLPGSWWRAGPGWGVPGWVLGEQWAATAAAQVTSGVCPAAKTWPGAGLDEGLGVGLRGRGQL